MRRRFIAPTRRFLSLFSVFVGTTVALLTPFTAAPAVTVFWNSPTGGDFNTAANWNPASVPASGDTAIFDIALSGNVTLSADAAPGSIHFDASATSFALGTLGGNTLMPANNGTISVLSTLTAAGQTFTVNAPLILTPDSATTSGAFTIQNSGTSASTALVIAGGISAGTTTDTETLTLGGTNTGANLVSGVISNGGASALAVVKSGGGAWTLSGANTYTGGTSIAAGTLALSGGANRLLSTGTLGFTGTSGTLDVGSTSQTLGGLTFTTMGVNSHVITGAGGTLSVTGGNIQVGSGNATATSTAETVDMSGLGTFSYVGAAGSFNVGGMSNSTSAAVSASGTLSLAVTNIITAGSFNVGSYTTGSNAINSGTVHLGQINTINASTFLVGNQKTNALLDFQNLVNPTLKIRGTGGTDNDRATVTIATNDSGLTATNATFDLTSGGTVAGTLDAMVGTMVVGQNLRNNTGIGQASNGSFTMGAGVLNATTLVLGQQGPVSGSNFSGAASGTLNLRGGTITAATLTLADKQSGAAVQAITSSFNLYSGTLNATTIQRGATGTGAGANTATINFNWVDGTVSNISGSNQTVNGKTAVSGLTGGLNIVLNNTGNISGTHTWNVGGTNTATVQNTVTLSGAGGLTKAGTGTLVLSSANTYTGNTIIAVGTLRFAAQTSLYNNNQASWTADKLVVNAGTTAAFNVGGAGEFTSADIGLLTRVGTATGGFQSGAAIALDTTNAAGGSFTLSAPITNANGGNNSLTLVKQGSGTLVLAAASTHTGGTQIDQGTLALNGGDNTLPASSIITFTGTSGTLDVGSTRQTVAALVFPTAGTTTSVITGAGSLTVTGGNIQIGGGSTAAASASQTVDMSGLSEFVYDNVAGNFIVGGQTDISNTGITGRGTLSLAAETTITAASFNVGYFSTGLSSANSGTVHLGQTTTINASTLLIGNQKTTGVLDFQNLVNPTLKIRGTGGTDSDRANWTVGPNASGVLPTVATVDLTSGGTVVSTLDAMVGTLAIGQNSRNATGLGQPTTATFTMGLGTLNATTIILGQQSPLTGSNTFSGNATATLRLNGGTITATTFTLADKQSGAAVQTINSTFNLNSGTLEAGTIQRGAAGTGAGADTATINFNWVDGTISNIAGSNQTVNGNTAVNGLTGGLNIVLNNTGNTSGTHTWNVGGTSTATVQSTVTLSGAGGLTKTGNGTLVFTGVNSYAGQTTVNAGELQLNATGGQSIAGNLAINGGTVRLLQANQISSTKNLVVNGGTFALQTFSQTLANVQLTGGGSITGTTGVLTSTNAYDLQSGSASAILAGTAGVVKSTGGTVVLSGANTFSGAVQVNGGTLVAGSSGALGANNALSIASGATLAYRPTSAGALNVGSGAITLAGGSTIGTAVAGTLSQSAITSSAAATASGAIKADIYGIPGASVTAGTHNLLTTAGGLTSGGATYSLGLLYNATNFTVSGFQATDTALKVNVAAATALTSVYWKGGLGAANNVWAASDGTASNWVTNANGTGTTPLTPGAGATVTFSATGATNQGAMVLGANMSVRNIVVNDSNGITLNADGNTLTLANAAGIAVNSGAGAVTLNAPIILGAAQSWTNNSASLLTIGGAVNNNTFGLTVNGSGRTIISGAISGTGGLTKSGTGALSLTGANTYTGSTNINGGALSISNGFSSTVINVASAGSSTGILNVQPGASLNLIGSNNNSIIVGSGAASAGAMYQSGGTILIAAQLNLGLGGTVSTPAYGFYSMSGGSLNDTGSGNVRFRIGGGGSGAMGVLYQTGGSININYGNGLEVGANATGGFSNATGVAYLTGGALTAPSNRIGYNSSTGSAGGVRGEQTVDGSAFITVNGTTFLAQAAGDIGILNLNGGIYMTRQIARGNAAGVSILNFDGGTLRAASSANSTFLTGLTSANVYAGGVTFDTNGQNLNIGQALLAPAGNGVTTIPVTNGGSGYVGPPIIAISGGGGSGATAVANMVDDGTGNGTFKIASITITSAGTGYTGAPTVDMIGGGGSGATLGTATTVANLSGGITKTGTGTLTMGGTNTYTGATVVEAGGTLAASSTSAFGVNSAATVDGTLRLNGRNNALGSLAGGGVVDNSNATAATVTVGGDNTSTTFSGSLQDGTGGALSVVKTGSGVQTLSGTSTYTGATTISQGTLQVGAGGIGSLAAGSAVSVNGASATLAGTGMVNGVVTVTSGFIQPGDAGGASTGTLTTGGLNLTAGGTATLQIQGASSFDHLTVLNPGGLTLDGRLVVTTSLTGPALDSAFAVGSSFDLLDWQGVLGGSFDVGALIRDGSSDNAAQFDLPDLSSLSRYWDLSQFLATGTIIVGVPEPGRATLLLLAFSALLMRRRRAGGGRSAGC